MKCILCENETFVEDSESLHCQKCNLLLNKNAWEKDYSDGGGQSIPSKNKRNLRLENSKARFQLFEPFIEQESFFIDIGCGSGEMLEVSKQYTKSHLGFDTNKILIDHCRSLGLNVVCDFFNQYNVEGKVESSLQKVFSACHVIEHMDRPLDFVKSVYETMNKGDVFYIEVPLYTGELFRRKKYNANVWIDEHIALYSLESLQYIAEQFNLNILELDYRNFINESKSKSFLFRNLLRNPIKFIYRYLKKHPKQQIADNIFRDYGYIILTKSVEGSCND